MRGSMGLSAGLSSVRRARPCHHLKTVEVGSVSSDHLAGVGAGRGAFTGWSRVAGCEDQLGRRTLRVCNATRAACGGWCGPGGGGPWSRESACQLTCRASWTGRARNEGRRWQEETTHLFKVGHPDLQMRDRVRYQDALPATRLWSGVCASSLPCALTSADP